MVSLVTLLFLLVAGVTPAAADQADQRDQVAPSSSQVNALTAQVDVEAAHIHQLTNQLDEARLQVSTTSDRILSVTRQDADTVQRIEANRAILSQQAVRAYMNGGLTIGATSGAGLADVTIGPEYLEVASGDLTNTDDQLRQMEESLRVDQATLRSAQQANVQATNQLRSLRTNAISVAASEQAQLDSVQTQLAAQARLAAAQSAARPAAGATQGVPVNNGLVTVVKQAIGLPVVAPVVATGSTSSSGADGGGNAPGVWLQLRECESSDNYAENTGNGYYGAYQFGQDTWTGLGYPGRPDQESPGMQDKAAMQLQAQSGWGQWPTCAATLGLM